MDFKFNDDSIYIVPNSLKIKLLNLLSKDSKIYNITFISLEELEKHYFFDIKEDALLYLLDKTKENIDVLKLMLKNLYKIDITKDYKESKLNNLKSLYLDLKDNNYLIFDKGYREYLLTKNIYILGYSMLEPYQKEMLNSINTNYLDITSNLSIDTVYKYRLTMLENSILLTKNYFLDGDFIQELYKSELLGVNIKRSVSYQENKRYLKYNESSDITSKDDMVSLREMFQRLKNTSSKTRSDL